MKNYFKVYLMNGTAMSFEGECNQIKYTDKGFMIFKHVDAKEGNEQTLAVIPYSNILYVLNFNEKEVM